MFVAIDDRESASAIETFDAEKRERTDFNTGISSKNCLDFFFEKKLVVAISIPLRSENLGLIFALVVVMNQAMH